MSRPIDHEFNCPECGKPHKVVMWSSLNVTLDPEQKQPLLEGKLTSFKCDGCGHSAALVYSLLYHDMVSGFMVWMLPSQPGEKAAEIPPDMPADISKDGRYRFRIVGSLNELREKITIFDGGLDDRIIEIAKMIVSGKLPEEVKQGPFEIYFDGITGQGDAAMMNFAAVHAKGHSGLSCTFDKMYDLLKGEFANLLETPTRGSWQRVNRDYAMEMIAKPKAPKSTPAPPAKTPTTKRWWRFGK